MNSKDPESHSTVLGSRDVHILRFQFRVQKSCASKESKFLACLTTASVSESVSLKIKLNKLRIEYVD